MTLLRMTVMAGLCLVAAFGCSQSQAPAGRWEGAFESPDVMVVARLEIDAKHNIYLSAPDATDIGGASPDDRLAIRERLTDGLALAWSQAQPRQFEFDGRVFRKPGGIAPQLEWNPDTGSMTAVVYLGLRAAIRIPLHPVSDFTNNPWTR